MVMGSWLAAQLTRLARRNVETSVQLSFDSADDLGEPSSAPRQRGSGALRRTRQAGTPRYLQHQAVGWQAQATQVVSP